MERVVFKIIDNKKIAKNVFEIKLDGNTDAITKSGQFVNIQLDGLYLRRPISVCDYSKNSLTLVYKVVGKGTEQLSKMEKGDLDVLVGLGNGYDTELSGKEPVLIGGGVGVPPLFNLCKKLLAEGKKPSVILGFNTKDEIFYEEEFKKLGVNVYVTTVNGEYGIKGFVTDALKNINYTYFYTCGPEPMLKAVYNSTATSGQLSFEERMGCGFGACMGCSIETKNGVKRVCKEGPVFSAVEVILWEKKLNF